MRRTVLVVGACILLLLTASGCIVVDRGPDDRRDFYADYDTQFVWVWPFWFGHSHHHGWNGHGDRRWSPH